MLIRGLIIFLCILFPLIASRRSKFLQQNQQNEAQNATPERKLVITSEEWCQMSDYSNTMVASMKLPPLIPSWINDGLVIVPTLSEYGEKAQYQLEVFSDHPLQVEPIAEEKARTLAGEWTEGTAGGSHMSKTYKKNPRCATECCLIKHAAINEYLSDFVP